MKKILTFFTVLLLAIFLSGCQKDLTLAKPSNIQMSNEGLVTWDKVENAINYEVTINGESQTTPNTFVLIPSLDKDFVLTVVAINGEVKSEVSEAFVYQAPKPIVPVEKPLDVVIAISGSSEVKCGKSITLKANVTGGKTNEVKWEVTKGSEYVTIDQNGVLQASDKTLDLKDVIVEVKATSTENPKCSTSKNITVLSKPKLTQEMLDSIGNEDYLQFEGYLNISLYPFGSKKLYQTYNTVIKTALDSQYWYAEYENASAMVTQSIYYKNHNGYACRVGVNFMNQEEYSQALDDSGKPYTWEDYGLYNNFKGLKVSDFTFDEETWRWSYSGNDERLDEKMMASMNPYDFVVNGFQLLIEEDEILGVYAKSLEDYTITQQYVAIQELFVVINKGEENVDCKRVPTYQYDETVHGPLREAMDKLRNADNYTLKFLDTQASVMTSSVYENYFVEYITDTDCYFTPFDIRYVGREAIYTPSKSGTYGYHKFSDNLYNSYYEEFDLENKHKGYTAARAYNESFDKAKPSFAFAPEIFNTYYVDEENNTTTYYVDEIMCGVASTFYYGVGTDINLYGIYATRGYTSQTESFTPYIVVDNNTKEVKSMCFYYYLGYIYGVIEITFDNVNQTTLPEDVAIDFDVRQVPDGWEDLTIIVNDINSIEASEVEVNALEYLYQYFEIADTIEAKEEFKNNMPFFANAIGDTYGFGMTQGHIDSNKVNHFGITLYYDVPLDINYSIESSLKKVEDYLLSIGFTKNKAGEFNKGDIWVHPQDKDLDFMIYVWKN